jgi:hypothetical protein
MGNITTMGNEMTILIKEGLEPLLEENEDIFGILPMPSRKNTFLFFTELRILYIIAPDFLRSRRFYSYPYETVKSLMIKERTSPLSEPKGELWFLIDYTSGDIIFADVFPPDSIKVIKDLSNRISAFSEIPMANKVYGRKKFIKIVNDPELALSNKKSRNIAFVLIAILLVAALVARSF